ncbi:hypothetical protein Godav_021384 [Gossypium davidsonii]|uniref:Uncharacterized protein n=2 Tax=Gossypium TaxID=3633 RepID=A0A7J8R622_GOSDV|nr:hypothetical protein [Gossypium davidsonii]
MSYSIRKLELKVVFVESDEMFVDILFSLLTLRLTRNQGPATNIVCMNNLYNSVEVLNAWYLRTKASKTMLLDSQNGATARFKNLKLAMDDNAITLEKLKGATTTAVNEHVKMFVKLMVNKSKNRVCYCETSEKLVDLHFSFLTVPLGFKAKEM